MAFSGYLHACHFRCVCTRQALGVFSSVWVSVCVHECHSRCVCTRAIFGVFARVPFPVCLHAYHSWCVCTRLAYSLNACYFRVLNARQFQCVRTSVVFGVFTHISGLCICARICLQYTHIILRMPGSRKKVDFDYAVYDKTGKQSQKGLDHKMVTTDLRVHALHITSEIEELFDSYQIENLTEEDGLNDYITKLGEAKRSFRRIHARLKIAEGDVFNENYPNYDNKLKDINKKFKLANSKLIDLRRASQTKKEEGEKLCKDLETKKLLRELSAMRNVSDEKRLHIKLEWEFWIEQIKCGLADSDWENFTEFEDIIRGMI